MNWNDPQVLPLWVGVAITLAYAILTGLIWDATRKNTTATKNILESAHRPYLAITSLDVGYEDGVIGGDPRITCILTNIGPVPAHVTTVELEIKTPVGLRTGGLLKETDQLALFPNHPFTFWTDLLAKEKPYAEGNPGLEVSVIARYKGVADKQYATHGKYTCNDDSSRLRYVSGSFY